MVHLFNAGHNNGHRIHYEEKSTNCVSDSGFANRFICENYNYMSLGVQRKSFRFYAPKTTHKFRVTWKQCFEKQTQIENTCMNCFMPWTRVCPYLAVILYKNGIQQAKLHSFVSFSLYFWLQTLFVSLYLFFLSVWLWKSCSNNYALQYCYYYYSK